MSAAPRPPPRRKDRAFWEVAPNGNASARLFGSCRQRGGGPRPPEGFAPGLVRPGRGGEREGGREVQEALFATWSVRLWWESGTQEGGEVAGEGRRRLPSGGCAGRGRSGAVPGWADGVVRGQKVTRSQSTKRPESSERGQEGSVTLQRASGGRPLAGLGWARLGGSSRTM